jgi:phage shock protein C
MRGRLDDVSVRWNIYRNATKGKIAGVCAGLSDRTRLNAWLFRAGFIVLAVVYHAIPAVILYLVLALVLRPRHEPVGYAVPESMPRSYGAMPGGYGGAMPSGGLTNGFAPGPRLTELKTRFTALDARLNRIEAIVTSEELSLRKKFRDLGG